MNTSGDVIHIQVLSQPAVSIVTAAEQVTGEKEASVQKLEYKVLTGELSYLH